MSRLRALWVVMAVIAVFCLGACQKDSGPTENEPPASDSVELDGTVQDLPASTPAGDLKVFSGFDSTAVQSNGWFRIPVSRTQNKAVLLVDSAGKLRHLTFFPARVNGAVEMSAKETAVSLIMMNPLLMPDTPELALEFRELIEGRGAFLDFKTTLTQKLQGGYALGDSDHDIEAKLALVYDDLYLILHQTALARAARDEIGPTNGLTLRTVGSDPANLEFQITNARNRWVAVWGTTHSLSGGFGPAQRLSLVPAPKVSILELILHGGSSEVATSPTLSLARTGRDFARIDCYGIGVNPNLSEGEFERVIEPALYTVVFDFSLPITSLLAGMNVDLEGEPAQHPFKRIVDLMALQCPDLSAELLSAMQAQDAPAIYTKLVACYVETLRDNPEEFAGAVREVIMAANGGALPRSFVKQWLFPARLVGTALGTTNLSWVFASRITSDVVTTFRCDIATAPVYDATVEGRVLDASTDAGLEGVEILVATAEGVPVDGIMTDAQGEYSAPVPAGALVLDFVKQGYFGARQTATVDPSSTTTLPAVRLASHDDARGTAGGKVIDAQSGFGLAGVDVRLVAGLDPEAVGEVATDVTDESGMYEFASIRPGSYTAVASEDGFISQWTYLAVVGGVTRSDFDITLSRPLGEGYRFVLTWGEAPSDLDSHLATPVIEGSAYEIRWNNRGSLDSAPYANLDVDDQSSYGPETITIAANHEGVYRYAIYAWSTDALLSQSQARVVLYSGDQILRQWTVPGSGDGRWWYVCDLNAITASVQGVNSIQSEPPTGISPSLMGVSKTQAGRNGE